MKQVYFYDLESWEATIEQVRATKKDTLAEKETYFCSTTAYSDTPITQRKTLNAPMFWQAAIAWEKEFGNSTIPVPFAKASIFLKKHHKDFRSMGPLIGCLSLVSIKMNIIYAVLKFELQVI